MKHFGKQHPDENPDYETLTPDNSIEEWVRVIMFIVILISFPIATNE